jgi:hypothetical protein
MFTFEKKTPCKKWNTPIAHYQENGKRKVVYYTECKCPDSIDKFKELQINPLEEQVFTPIPFFSKNQRITISISGFSGSGKSRYCNKLVEEIIELNKKKHNDMNLERILLITSAQESDPAYENLGKIRLDIPYAMKNGVDINAFANSVLIFDDFTNQPTKEMDLWVKSLEKQLLERSRKLKTHLIFCSHQQRNGFKTSLLNIESQSFVLFYQSNRNESAKLLQHYLDFSKKDIEKLFSIDNGRFSTAYINRNPRYVITNHYMYMY